MKRITLEVLVDCQACDAAIERFEQLFPDGCDATAENGWKISGDWPSWAFTYLLDTDQAREVGQRMKEWGEHDMSAPTVRNCPYCQEKGRVIEEVYNRES
jgi:hypothetical protein